MNWVTSSESRTCRYFSFHCKVQIQASLSFFIGVLHTIVNNTYAYSEFNFTTSVLKHFFNTLAHSKMKQFIGKQRYNLNKLLLNANTSVKTNIGDFIQAKKKFFKSKYLFFAYTWVKFSFQCKYNLRLAETMKNFVVLFLIATHKIEMRTSAAQNVLLSYEFGVTISCLHSVCSWSIRSDLYTVAFK